MEEAALLPLVFVAGVTSMMAPCSFAMLPSYISFYVSRDEGSESIGTGLKNGLLATMGSGAVRGSIGLLAIFGLQEATRQLSYFSVVIGAILIAMGLYLLSGGDFGIPLPVTIKMRKGSLGVFTFGAMYSLASFGCTLAVFLGLILAASALGTGTALMAIVVYIAGIGALLIPLTVAVSTSRTIFLDKIQKFLPYVRVVSGIILVAMGCYLILFKFNII